jgi:hypothetical protein
MQRCMCDGGCGMDAFQFSLRYILPFHDTLLKERENALVPASVPRHPPLTVSLSTGTAMKESDNLVECLLPFHDTRPLLVLSLSAGTAI